MKVNGSVLIVVLGLLAILAVVGVAFVTMSSIDRSTAANFAANTQLMMAADSGVDYAAHYLVNDVWQLTGSGTTKKHLLLTNTTGFESFDAPGTDDPWLTEPITGPSTNPAVVSFSGTTVPAYGINFNSKSAAGWDNLGSGGTNGVFLTDLAFPYESRIVRVSVTILDHGGLINLNAHGNQAWPDAVRGVGYYVSDVNPACAGAPLTNLADILFNGRTLGRWGPPGSLPNITQLGETAIENPVVGGALNYPFTLDEEFELRRLQPNPLIPGNSPGTLALTRVEIMGPNSNTMTAAQRLMYTTVGWTAQVRGDGNATDHRTVNGYSRPKADLNRDSAQTIFEALTDARAGTPKQLAQLAANIVRFRDKTVSFDPITITGAPDSYVGADRQPIFTEAWCTKVPGEDADTERWQIEMEVYNPWPGKAPGDVEALDTSAMNVDFGGGITKSLPATMLPGGCTTITATGPDFPQGEGLADHVPETIKMTVGTTILDEITDLHGYNDMQKLATNPHLTRPVCVATETRAPGCDIRILYLRDWTGTPAETRGSVTSDATIRDTVPIRFPNSVTSNADGTVLPAVPILPPFGSSPDFKAIARLGDLDQVLCPKNEAAAGTAFWPWTNRVAKCTNVAQESDVKFNWKPTGSLVPNPTPPVDLAWAANVLCVGGPWNDNIDNDGDTATDALDTARNTGGGTGRFAGPEFRVAGLINLNTATPMTLKALNDGLGLNNELALPALPIRSPAQILSSTPATAAPEAKGYLEKRDWVFNRVSNIVTVRSDTFSVYGTAQLFTVEGSTVNLAASRRFWALLDRSVSLAYPPTRAGADNVDFMHPRILNFQWLD